MERVLSLASVDFAPVGLDMERVLSLASVDLYFASVDLDKERLLGLASVDLDKERLPGHAYHQTNLQAYRQERSRSLAQRVANLLLKTLPPLAPSVFETPLVTCEKAVQCSLSYSSQVINSDLAQCVSHFLEEKMLPSFPLRQESRPINFGLAEIIFAIHHLISLRVVEKLTKPIIFVVDHANWLIRRSLLSTPLVPALCLSSRSPRNLRELK